VQREIPPDLAHAAGTGHASSGRHEAIGDLHLAADNFSEALEEYRAALKATGLCMVAVDLSPDAEPLAEALRSAVRRAYEYRRAVRLACVTVRTLLKVGVVDANVDQAGRNLRVQRLAELKHWALPLGLPTELISFHVLEADDPAAALIEYARENRVDHVVIGARGSSAMRRILGSVSARVVAEAPCTVTIVRTHRGAAAGDAEGPGADLDR